MVAADPNALFVRAERAFGAGRWAEARAALDRLMPLTGPHATVLHLSGLVHRRLGMADRAVDDLVAAARLAPGDPEVFNNLGNALADAGRLEDALEAHRAAARLKPGWADAHRNAALTLLELDCAGDALAEAEAAVRADAHSAAGWSVLGRVRMALDDQDEAAEAFDRALERQPTLASALGGRAHVALARGESDAAERHERALAASPANTDLLAGAVQARPDEAALERLAGRLTAEPGWLTGHRVYAHLASELGHRVDETLARARADRPDDTALLIEQLATLVNGERATDALAILDALPDRIGTDPQLWVFEAAAATMAGDHARAGTVLQRLDAVDPEAAAEPRARLALTRRDPAAAAAALEPLTKRGAAGVTHWALLSLAWRMLGDEREAWLHGDPAFVSTRTLALGEEDRQALVGLLRDLHATRRAHPLGQSMRGGTQTRGRLLARTEPVIRRLGRSLTEAVEAHRGALPPADPRHPLLRHRDRQWAITGSWSVRLAGSGFHIHHVHPHGVVSSAAYLHLPPIDPEDAPHAGWLALGASPAELRLELPPTRLIEPAVGRLALFPSTLFHGTVPFRAGERLTVAFDVAPAG